MNAFGLYAEIIGVYDSGLTTAQGRQVDGLVKKPTSARMFHTIGVAANYTSSIGVPIGRYTDAPAFNGFDQYSATQLQRSSRSGISL